MPNMTPFFLRVSLLSCFVCTSLLASMPIILPAPSFAQVQTTNNMTEQEFQSLAPQLLSNSSWKISTIDGPADWSPTEDLLVVSSWGKFQPSAILLYGANGTKLMTIAEFEQGEFISLALFSPNGSKIAFAHPPGSTNQLEVFDLKTRATQNFQFQGNFTYFDWMPDGNHIIYLMSRPSLTEGEWPAYELRVHDLRTGSETVIDSVTNVQYFDLSQDGTTLLLVRQVIGQQPCEQSIDGNCYADEIVTLKLAQNNSVNNSTESQDEQTDNSPYIISSQIIWRNSAPPHAIVFPRWVLNDSAIVFSVGSRCGGPIIAISPDGTRNQTFFAASGGGTIDGACDENGGVFNQDGTILAYAKGTGICGAYCPFNPVNTGLYLTFTELCVEKQCTPPSSTIPVVDGLVMYSFGASTVHGSQSYGGYINVGYQEIAESVLDEKTKTLSVRFQTPLTSELVDERDVLLYLPSALINGDMVVFINGTQFYPSLVEDEATCPDNWYGECDKVIVEIDKIEGWSIVNVKDDTTARRSAVLIEIVGTTATPEIGSFVAVFAVAVAMLIGSKLASNWRRTMKR